MGASTPDRAADPSSPSTIVIDPVKLLSSFSQLPASRSATAAIQLVLSSVIQSPETPRKRMSETDRGSKRARTEEWECQMCDPSFHTQANLRRHEDKHPVKESTRNSQRQTLEKNLPRHGLKYNESKKWRCSVCSKILASKSNLNRHYDNVHAFMATPLKASKVVGRGDLRSRTPCNEHKEAETTDVKSIMFVCECTLATENIDCAFEHAQLHILEGFKPILQTCDNCKFTFEAQYFSGHLQNHNDNEKQPVSYIPFKLLNTEWSDMFPNLSEAQVNRIKSLSIYEHTRKVKMNCDHDNGKPLYLCDTCELYVSPAEVEDHCNEENACLKSQSSEHFCSECEIFFYTSEALREHEKDHEEGLGVDSFRTVTFNCKWDVPLNKALRQPQKTSHMGENSRGDETSCPVEVPPVDTEQCNRKNKGIEILSVSQLCCGKFIPLSELEAHTATHAVYKRTEESNEIIENEVSQEQNGVMPDNKNPNVSLEQKISDNDSTSEVFKSTEDTINQEKNNFGKILLSKATLEDADTKRDAINAPNSEITTPSKVRKITGLNNNFSEEMKNELRQELQKLMKENNSTALLDGDTTDNASEKDHFVGNKKVYQRCEGTITIDDILIEETQNTNELNKIQDISSALRAVNTIENVSEKGNFVDNKEFNQRSNNIKDIFIEETHNTNEVNKILDISSALRAVSTTGKGNFVDNKEFNKKSKNIEHISIVETQNTNELNKIHDNSSVLRAVNTIENASEKGNFVENKEFNQRTKNIEDILIEETQNTNEVNKIPDINSALRAVNTIDNLVDNNEFNQGRDEIKTIEDILIVETQNTNELNEIHDIKADAEILLPETQQNKDNTAIPEELCDSSIKNESDESGFKKEIVASNPRPSSRYILSKMLLGNGNDLSEAIEEAKNDEKRKKSEHQSFIEEARRIRNIMFSRD